MFRFSKTRLSVFLLTALVVALAVFGNSLHDHAPSATSHVRAGGEVSFVEGILSTSHRSNLSVCVDGAGGATIGNDAILAVQQALEQGLESVSTVYSDALMHLENSTVSAGCPPPTAALTSEELASAIRKHGDLHGEPAFLWSPDAPSEHRVFVYFVPSDVYASVFGTKPYAEGAAEFFCEALTCAEVTTAIYVSESVVVSTLADGLLDAIGYLPTDAGDAPRSPEERNQKTREALEDAGVPQSEIDDFFERACTVVPSACSTETE